MGFNLQNWSRTTASANEPITALQVSGTIGAPRVYTYSPATDSQATIEGSGYFNSVAGDLVTGDVILSYSANDGTWVWLTATNSTGTAAGVITTSVFAAAGTVGTSNITNNAVTYAKIQQASAGDVLLANPTGSAANYEEITLGNGLAFSGTTLELLPSFTNVASGTLSSANLVAMYATPISLISAPGSNLSIVIHKFELEYVKVTTAYATDSGSVFLTYGSSAHAAANPATAGIALTGLTDQTVSTLSAAGGAITGLALTAVTDTAVFISNTSGALATGDGTAKYNIWYSVISA